MHTYIPPACAVARNSLKAGGQHSQRAQQSCSPPLKRHSPLLPDEQSLKTYFIYIGNVFSGREVNLVSISIFARSRNTSYWVLFITSIHQLSLPHSSPCHTTFFKSFRGPSGPSPGWFSTLISTSWTRRPSSSHGVPSPEGWGWAPWAPSVPNREFSSYVCSTSVQRQNQSSKHNTTQLQVGSYCGLWYRKALFIETMKAGWARWPSSEIKVLPTSFSSQDLLRMSWWAGGTLFCARLERRKKWGWGAVGGWRPGSNDTAPAPILVSHRWKSQEDQKQKGPGHETRAGTLATRSADAGLGCSW